MEPPGSPLLLTFKDIYLASLGLSCLMQDHAGSLVAAACEPLAAAYELQFPLRDGTWTPCIGSAES